MLEKSRIYAKIDMAHIEENLRAMKGNLLPETQIVAVIKADGYGHGAVEIAKFIEAYEFLWGFAVATVDEAMELRENKIHKPILILGYTFHEDYSLLIEHDIRPTIFQLSDALALSKKAAERGKEVSIHIAVDTGMSRIGYLPKEESFKEIFSISQLENIKIEGIFTHFSKADEYNLEHSKGQLKRFVDFKEKLESKGLCIPIVHASNSAAIIRLGQAQLDLVRAGISMYGIYPSNEVERDNVKLKPAMSIYSHITYIKEVDAGVLVSYGGTFTTKRKTKIATIPVGYADGYPRSLSNKGWVLIHGKKAPIIGRICMDQFMVDVTDIEEALALDEVVLLGESQGNNISADELGQLSGRFHYEFVCDINKRVPRIYVYGDKSWKA
ncbi:MAG TPA: alanine racemase [Lachnospiraceae bacterium]